MFWSEKEQSHLLEAIPTYRDKIKNKDLKEAKRLTLELAEEIHHSVPDVQGRTVNAINERLPYLENLLAGVFEAHHYAIKDRSHYLSMPRENGSKEPNLCNTRHKYNGAMTEYLQRNRQTQR
jgi:hypothetical protein